MAYEVMSAADALLVASGTATLEAACFGTPMVVVYDGPPTGRLEYELTRRVRHVSLPNIIGDHEIVPELLGKSVATPGRIADLILELIENGETRDRMRRGLADVRGKLGPGGAIRRTADLVANLTRQSRSADPQEEPTPSQN